MKKIKKGEGWGRSAKKNDSEKTGVSAYPNIHQKNLNPFKKTHAVKNGEFYAYH